MRGTEITPRNFNFGCVKSLGEGVYQISRRWPSNAKLSSLHWNGPFKMICWGPFIVRDRGSVLGRGQNFWSQGFHCAFCILGLCCKCSSTDLSKNGHQQGGGSTGALRQGLRSDLQKERLQAGLRVIWGLAEGWGAVTAVKPLMLLLRNQL